MAQLFKLPKAVPVSAGESYGGAKAYFFLTNTVTPVDTYTTPDLDVTHDHPVEADANGVFPPIWFDPALAYKLTLKTYADSLIYTVDPVNDFIDTGDVRQYGVTGDGVTDDTSALIAAFTVGGDLYVPEGDYLIAGAGADTGGAYVTITKNTRVTCHPNARFFTDSLDNDLVRFTVPSDGTGLPADGITFEWHGGIFDQRDQKNSTVFPFDAEYPPVNPGTSSTCDALSVRGDYSVASVEYFGIKRAVIENVSTVAGDHWESAGGDGAVFVGGCAKQIVRGVRSVGARDLSVYASGTTLGTKGGSTLVEGCEAINCFGAVNIKRSGGDSNIIHNHAENCPRGFAADWVDGDGANRVRIVGNTGINLGIMVRAQLCTGFDISSNHCTSLGALLEDGTTIEDAAGCNGIELWGCSKGVVKNNTVNGIDTGVGTAYPSDYMLIQMDSFTHDAVPTDTTRVVCYNNVGDGLRICGYDGGTENSLIENYVVNAVTSANWTPVGTNSFEIRVDPATMSRSYTTPLGFADGSTSAPIIMRRAQTSVGWRFAASTIGAVIAGTDSIRMDNSTTATHTRLLVYDVDNATVERVTVGAADSGGTNFKVLRIPN